MSSTVSPDMSMRKAWTMTSANPVDLPTKLGWAKVPLPSRLNAIPTVEGFSTRTRSSSPSSEQSPDDIKTTSTFASSSGSRVVVWRGVDPLVVMAAVVLERRVNGWVEVGEDGE